MAPPSRLAAAATTRAVVLVAIPLGYERTVADSFYKSRKGPMVINGTVSSFTEQIIIRIGAINEGQ